MKLFVSRKGLAHGLLALIVVLFTVALASIFSLTIWGAFVDAVNDVDNTTIQPDVKQDVQNLTPYMGWASKIFVTLFIILMIGYIMTSATLPVNQEVFLLIFIGFLIMVTFFAMILSNTWVYISEQPQLISALGELDAISYIFRFFPAITFLTGVIGAVIFYTRKTTGAGGGGDTSGFE